MAAYDLPKRLLHWLAVISTISVLGLICSGGLVTSHEAGMAVPDWPNSFGYNMFLFPISRWVGGVFFEHTHRLIASLVGLLTIGLCIATWLIEDRRWVKWLASVAVLAVIVQGVLGGLRVTEHNALLGLFHGCLAQSFLALMATLALVTSLFWIRLGTSGPETRQLRTLSVVVTAMIFAQLVLGVAMRHSHAGLSIPDFPTTYGGWLPPLDPAAIAKINEARGAVGQPFISVGLILLQYVHRVWALLIAIGVVWTSVKLIRSTVSPKPIQAAGVAWIFLVFTQLVLGAWTVLSNKAADIATSHVLGGALMLVIGVLLSVALSRILACKDNRTAGGSRVYSMEIGKV
ncbi:MAG TPA: COX15/CtaA family protein [Chthoniobacterales bacterium]|nr:COX15/CtaA family protein [Chthoniobacterales bacterium]